MTEVTAAATSETNGSTPGFQQELTLPLLPSEHVKQRSTEIVTDRPILTATEIGAQMGSKVADVLGELEAVIELPEKASGSWHPEFEESPEPTYIFRKAVEGRHGLPSYTILGREQLKQLQSSLYTGVPSLEDIGSGIIVLSRGQSHTIGLQHWLPNLSSAVDLVGSDPADDRKFKTISQRHAVLRVDGNNTLHLDDMSKNGTYLKRYEA